MTPTRETIRKIQRLIGAVPDGLWGVDSDTALDLALASLELAYNGSSQIPPDYLDKLAKIESDHRPYVKARTSSGSGLYQFLRATWIREGGQWGSDPSKAFGGLKPSPEEQTNRARSFTQSNADALAHAQIKVTNATLYAAHFLGVGTAIRVLGEAPSTPIEQVTSPAQRSANPSILKSGSTVADFIDWLARKIA